ncbi:MAG: nuclear transport factor 2 family protein [Ilumatobacteraceae bacterium]
MELWELFAREHIRDTVSKYNAAGDRGDAATVAGLFVPDGVLDEGTAGEVRGRAAIERFIGGVADDNTKVPGPRFFIHHHVSNVAITKLTPERAEATSYFAVFTNEMLDHWGRYRDVLVPFDDAWRFERRRVTVDKALDGSLHAEFVRRLSQPDRT